MFLCNQKRKKNAWIWAQGHLTVILTDFLCFIENLIFTVISFQRQQEEESSIEEFQSSMAAQNEAINALEQVLLNTTLPNYIFGSWGLQISL